MIASGVQKSVFQTCIYLFNFLHRYIIFFLCLEVLDHTSTFCFGPFKSEITNKKHKCDLSRLQKGHLLTVWELRQKFWMLPCLTSIGTCMLGITQPFGHFAPICQWMWKHYAYWFQGRKWILSVCHYSNTKCTKNVYHVKAVKIWSQMVGSLGNGWEAEILFGRTLMYLKNVAPVSKILLILL